MLPNRPMFLVVESDGAIVRLLIVKPWPSKMVLNADVPLPIGVKFAMELALMLLPSAYAFGLMVEAVTAWRSAAVLTSM